MERDRQKQSYFFVSIIVSVRQLVGVAALNCILLPGLDGHFVCFLRAIGVDLNIQRQESGCVLSIGD